MTFCIGRREFITLLGGAAAWPLFARAQERPKPLRIGTVSLNRRASAQRVAFEQRLRELGYIEGQNLVIEYINAPDRPHRIDEAARELVRRNVDIIVLENHITLKSVMSATSTLPIVIIATSFDPVALGIVASIARPGGNITGFYVRRPELVEKQIGLLAETFPGRTRLDVIWDAVSGEAFPAAERTAIALRWGLEPLKLENPPYDFVAAFRSLAQRGAQMVPRSAQWSFHRRPGAYRSTGVATWPAEHVHRQDLCGCRWADVLGAGPVDRVSAGGRLCRPHCQGSETRRPAHRVADKFRSHAQPEDRQSPRP